MIADLVASQPHYLDHLAPIWHALDRSERGNVYVPPKLRDYANSLGIFSWHDGADTLLAAAWSDIKGNHQNRRRVLMEHGIGQSYREGHSAYAGGHNRRGVDLFLCPNERVAELNRPDGDCVVIGSPYFDQLAKIERQPEPDLVVVSHHWNCMVAPETWSTRRHWRPAINSLQDVRVAHHAHPRDAAAVRRSCAVNDVPFMERFEDVVANASVYVCDNSSTLFYAAALGIPVVLLNAPWYRRDVHHGLRFWEHAGIGPQVWSLDALQDAVIHALHNPGDPDLLECMRYDLHLLGDQKSAQRAVEALRT